MDRYIRRIERNTEREREIIYQICRRKTWELKKIIVSKMKSLELKRIS